MCLEIHQIDVQIIILEIVGYILNVGIMWQIHEKHVCLVLRMYEVAVGMEYLIIERVVEHALRIQVNVVYVEIMI